MMHDKLALDPSGSDKSKNWWKRAPMFCYGRILLDHGRFHREDGRIEAILAKPLDTYTTIVASGSRSLGGIDTGENHASIISYHIIS